MAYISSVERYQVMYVLCVSNQYLFKEEMDDRSKKPNVTSCTWHIHSQRRLDTKINMLATITWNTWLRMRIHRVYALLPSPQCLDEEYLVLRLIVLNIGRSRVRSKVSQQFWLRYKYVSWYLTQLVSILFYFVRLLTICQRIKVFYNASKFAWYCTFVTKTTCQT